MAEVKVAVGEMQFKLSETLPDGSRLYVVHLPVDLKYAERKGCCEVMIVRCKDREEVSLRFERVEKFIEFAATWVNGSTYSFSSCSTQKAQSDEEALWEVARDLYHSGW